MRHLLSLVIFLLFLSWLLGRTVRSWCCNLVASDEQSKIYAQIDDEIEREEKRLAKERIQKETQEVEKP